MAKQTIQWMGTLRDMKILLTEENVDMFLKPGSDVRKRWEENSGVLGEGEIQVHFYWNFENASVEVEYVASPIKDSVYSFYCESKEKEVLYIVDGKIIYTDFGSE